MMLTLREMHDIARGEVSSMEGLIRKGQRSKPPRPENWIAQHQRILQHRKQVVKVLEQQIDARKAEGEAAA
ncbi:hypothetical protein [Ochrobactrum sp. Marseille-Q0166]|uniref:hypothetical protein n=1 Tax=Ochrobactrum sp. Marseille-Q0166 TaxID=2761105 RepID=UPI001655067A|nr:hypothetical protein [Ochrobactrum sp. Marseille-Q0166]MBC8718797.1 hypothetical protein [Ochrobactrum sp. Marseille-Q0166]